METENKQSVSLREDLKDFNYNNIWVTKKIRMDSAEKMRKNNTRINYFLIYYSASLAVMSFLTIYDNSGFNLSLFSSMITLILPSANIFQYKADYSKKEDEYTKCYLQLSNLENNINTFLLDNKDEEQVSSEDVDKYKTEYEQILQEFINHDSEDYYLFCLKQQKKNNNKKNFYVSNNIKYYLLIKRIFFSLILLIIAILPLALILKKIYSYYY
ncbi:SLATT domain-containing protein [Enterococcus sp. LJL99]